MRKWIEGNNLKFLRIGLSVLLFALLIYFTQPWNVLPEIIQFAPSMIGILILGFSAIIFLNAITGWWLIQEFHPLGLQKAMRYYLYSWSTEFFLPGKLGMFSIAYFLTKEKIEIGKSVAVVLITKFFTFVLLLLLSFVGVTFLFPISDYYIYIGLSLAGLLGVYVIFFTVWGRELIKKHILKKYSVYFTGFSAALNQIFKNPMRLAGLLVLLFLTISVNALMVQILFQQAGYPLNFFIILSVVSMVILVGLIPITFNGLGLKEGALVLLLSQFGVPSSIALVVGTISTVVGYVISLLVSWFIIRHLPFEKLEEYLHAHRHVEP